MAPKPGTGIGSKLNEMMAFTSTVITQAGNLVDFLDYLVSQFIGGKDAAGREATYSIGGEQAVGFKIDDISINFQYGISTEDIKDGGVITGTGVVGTDGSMVTIATGAGIGSALIESLDAIRYRAGHTVLGEISWIFAESETDVNQIVGFLNGMDAWSLGYQELVFGLWFIEGGNINFIDQADWNIDKMDGTGPSGYNLNPQKAQVYRLSYGWHGFLPMSLEVKVDQFKWRLAHLIEFTNSADEPHLENPNLPLAGFIERTAGSGDSLVMKSGSWRAGVIAGVEENNNSDRWFADFNINLAVSGTNYIHLLTLRNKDTYQSKVNHIKSLVKVIVSINSTNKDVVFVATRLSALDTADQLDIIAGFSDIDTLNSVMESSTAARTITTTITKAMIGDVAVVSRNGQRSNTDVQGLRIHPGRDIVFLALIEGAGDVSFQLNEKELH